MYHYNHSKYRASLAIKYHSDAIHYFTSSPHHGRSSHRLVLARDIAQNDIMLVPLFLQRWPAGGCDCMVIELDDILRSISARLYL